MNPVIETKRLILRSVKSSDINSIIQLWTDPEVTQYMGGPRQPKALKETLQNQIQKEKQPIQIWPVFLKETKTYIGDCGLMHKTVDHINELEVIYLIQKEYWNQGYASEASRSVLEYAFETLDLKRIIALIHPENPASEKVAKKIGMQLEKETLRPSGIKMKVYKINKTEFIYNIS